MKHFFDSAITPGHWMNKWGVVFVPRDQEPGTCWGRSFADVPTAQPHLREAVHAEAHAAGYSIDYLKRDCPWQRPPVVHQLEPS